MFENRSQLVTRLEELADAEYKRFTLKLLPGVNNLIGVCIPELRLTAKKIARENPYMLLDSLNYMQYFEEFMLCGMVIGYADMDKDSRLERLCTFIDHIDNWSVCDSTISTCKFMKKDQDFWFEFIKEQLNMSEEYHIRFGAVCIKNYFINDTYIDESIMILQKIKTDQYYAQMSIAWTLCEMYFKYPGKITDLFENKSLNTVILKMTIQKIRESDRGTKESRKQLLKYK